MSTDSSSRSRALRGPVQPSLSDPFSLNTALAHIAWKGAQEETVPAPWALRPHPEPSCLCTCCSRLLETPEGLGDFPTGSRGVGRVSTQQRGFLELGLFAPSSTPPSVVSTVRVDGAPVGPRAPGAYSPDSCCIPASRGDKWARPAHEFQLVLTRWDPAHLVTSKSQVLAQCLAYSRCLLIFIKQMNEE